MVSVNDVNLEVYEAGRENTGNPIVLCYGWPEHCTDLHFSQETMKERQEAI